MFAAPGIPLPAFTSQASRAQERRLPPASEKVSTEAAGADIDGVRHFATLQFKRHVCSIRQFKTNIRGEEGMKVRNRSAASKLTPLVASMMMALPVAAVRAGNDAPVPSAASDQEAQVELAPMTITGAASKPDIPDNVTLTSTVESVTAQQINESINAVTTGEVLEYQPSTHVRERYIGDVNGVLVMRINSSIQAAETVVYADGMLISNLLGNS